MAKFLKLINGIPTAVEVTASVSLTYYDESIPVTTDIGVEGTGYDSDHLVFTLPNSETYDGTKNQLEVLVNEALWEPGVHYNYQNSSTATYVTMLTPIPKNSRVRFRKIY